MVRTTGPGTMTLALGQELTEEDKREASLVLAGIAAENCSCQDSIHRACGLRDVLEALSLVETEEIMEDETSD